jgi:mycofactocin glycosyltransferase
MPLFGRSTRSAERLPRPPTRRARLPAGFTLAAEPKLRRLGNGRVLVGGNPGRVVRLSPKAAGWVDDWLSGAPVGETSSERSTAARLVAGGLLHPRPPLAGPEHQDLISVIVPVRDRPVPLSRLLASLNGLHCVVVDDASTDGPRIEKVAREAGAEYLRLERHSGAAAARNAGLARARRALVAFIDSDCVVPSGWTAGLFGHFADPGVGAVAPRIVSAHGGSWLARYEGAHSPLDLGPVEGKVAAGTPISYVPAAALVVRRSACDELAFDERLAAGEDVDFVWRLGAAGWTVRYDPSVEVTHHGAVDTLGWTRRRFVYGSSAGALARRHGSSVAPARVPLSAAATWALLAVDRPAAAAVVSAVSISTLSSRLAGVVDEPVSEGVRLYAQGTVTSILPTIRGLTRAWAPVLGVISLSPRARRLRLVALGALGAGVADQWRQRPARLDPAHYTVARLADLIAYGSGVWWGCLRERTIIPLIPQLVAPRRRSAGRVKSQPVASPRPRT